MGWQIISKIAQVFFRSLQYAQIDRHGGKMASSEFSTMVGLWADGLASIPTPAELVASGDPPQFPEPLAHPPGSHSPI